jgi:hypothetical protein
LRFFLDALLMKRVAEIEISCRVLSAAFRNRAASIGEERKELAISHSVGPLAQYRKKNCQGHNPNHYPKKKIFRFRHLLIAANLVHFALLVHDSESCCRLIAKGKYPIFSVLRGVEQRDYVSRCPRIEAEVTHWPELDPCIPRLPRLPATWPPEGAG